MFLFANCIPNNRALARIFIEFINSKVNMPAVGDDSPMYCSQQINIPPDLPDVLKQFTKAAIRTQPGDVLQWSAAYFNALSNGETPPVKERLEMPMATQKTDTGLTPGILSVLNRQLSPKKVVSLAEVEQKWKDNCLPKERLQNLMQIGSFGDEFDWLKFFALACSALAGNITSAMKVICEILTKDPEGGAARIQFDQFKELYTYLAQIDGDISEEQMESVFTYLQYHVDKQEGMVQPRNFLNPDCPKLGST
ncbi:ropporin-1-like protein isoform X2 [Apostichopus japonicus]|uniref:ropporin-1-like protein isoform X2 n=1 Tax=Stichopus japonicus TaxID=307972 RepID=UPI003AB31AA5